jgi:hypothetical protein
MLSGERDVHAMRLMRSRNLAIELSPRYDLSREQRKELCYQPWIESFTGRQGVSAVKQPVLDQCHRDTRKTMTAPKLLQH